MHKRPLIFIIIGILHVIEPLVKILYFKLTTPFALSTILTNISNIDHPRAFFEFWLLFPIGGIALLGVKKWSYPIFVGVQFYNIWSHLNYESFTWPYVSEVPFFSSLALLVINIFVIIYFALPDVRRPFFDKRMRWWETSTRYQIRIPIHVVLGNGEEVPCDIINISRSGVFINLNRPLEIHQIVTLKFKYQEFDMSIKSKNMSNHSVAGINGHGLQFEFENIWQNIEMRKVVAEIKNAIKQQEKLSKAAQC